jgi:hypothetical protein
MKNIFRLFAFSFLVFSISSCEKKEAIDYFEGGTPPALTESVSTVTLEPGLEANTAITFQWTNPQYKFTTGISSLDVTYTLEIDTLGANFGSSKKSSTVLAKDLSKTFTVGELNSILGNDMLLQLLPRRNYTMQVRVIAAIGTSEQVISNVITFTTKPFQPPPKVAPPITGTLYIVGSATPGGSAHGWDNPISLTVSTQQFIQQSNTHYTITIPLIGDGEYKLIGSNGSWNDQWSTAINDDPNELYGGDFVFNGQNIKAPPVSGSYIIDVNFQTGKFTVTLQ